MPGLTLLLLMGTASLILAVTFAGGFVCLFTEKNPLPKLAFCVLLALGCAVALWATFFLEYQPSPTERIAGVPYAVVTFHLKNGNWSDSFSTRGMYLDLILIPAAFTAPASIKMLRPILLLPYRRYRSKRRLLQGRCPTCNYDLRGTKDTCPECGMSVPIT